MKMKRCTNSTCRRQFRADACVCPHCGKKYPRSNLHRGFTVILTNAGASKLATIKAIRPYTGLGLRDAKTVADHAPSLVGNRFSEKQVKALKADIRAAGGTAMVIPGCRSAKGIFVLPVKAG